MRPRPTRPTLMSSYVFNTIFEDHRLEIGKRGYDDVLDYVLRDDLPRSSTP